MDIINNKTLLNFLSKFEYFTKDKYKSKYINNNSEK